MFDPLSVAAALGIGTLNSTLNYKSQQKTNALNYKMFQEGNQFAHDEAQLAFDRQSQFAWDMFNAENQYNTPAEMFQRLEAAGLSPWDYFGKGNALASAQGSNIGSPAASPVGIPAMHAPTFDFNTVAAVDAFSKIVGTISNSKLQGAERDKILATIQPLVDQIKSETARNEAQKYLDEVNAFASKMKLRPEIYRMQAEYVKLMSEGDLNEAKKVRENLESEFTKDKRFRFNLETPKYLANLDKLGQVYESERARNYASANESQAHAGLYSSETEGQNYSNQVLMYESAYKQLEGSAKVAWIEENVDKLVDSFDAAIESSRMSDWQKYEAQKRLHGFYKRLNEGNERKRTEAIDDFFNYVHREFGMNFGGSALIQP